MVVGRGWRQSGAITQRATTLARPVVRDATEVTRVEAGGARINCRS